MSEIEKQFFETFEIEPNIDYFVSFTNDKTKIVRCFHLNKEELLYRYKNTKDKLKVLRVDFDYPEITDSILLELICILTKRFDYADQNWLTKCNDTKELKVSVLRLLLLCPTSIIEEYKHQVRTLFKEV